LAPVIKHKIIETTPLYVPELAKAEPERPVLKPMPIVPREPIEIVKTPLPITPVDPPKVLTPKVVTPQPPAPKNLIVRNVFKPAVVAMNTPKAIALRRPQHIPGFDAASSVPSPEGRAKRDLKLGGFGAQTAAAAVAVKSAKPNVGSFGSADAWGGSGAGGAKIGKPEQVVSAGFADVGVGGGSGYAHYAARQQHGNSPVKIGGSGFDSPSAAATPARRMPAVALVPRTTPPEILEKPRPAYTEAALKQRIEGEVVLRVILGAAGDVRVLGIVQTLGYGLDQTAQDAARRIRFQPAMQDGHPVDYTAILHITFSLAY
jgi:TonB family protein